MDISEDTKISEVYHLRNGKAIPVIHPIKHSSKIKTRHLKSAAGKFLSLANLLRYLEQGYKLIDIRYIENFTSSEEELLALTYRVVVIEKNGIQQECLTPADESAVFHKYSTEKCSSSNVSFHRGVSDNNGFAIVNFTYNNNLEYTEINFNVFYVDLYTLLVSTHNDSISVKTKNGFKLNVMIKGGLLCFVFPFHNSFSIVDFTIKPSKFTHFIAMKEDMKDLYKAELDGEYLAITLINSDFFDSVFFEIHGSKRETIYYSVKTGARYSSKNVMSKLQVDMMIENPVDILLIDMPSQPMWMVTECLPVHLTLSKITFFTEVDLKVIKCIKILDLVDMFLEYDSLFELPNEYQIAFAICRLKWHIFLWISKTHILEVNLESLEPVCILKMHTNQFNDFKSEKHDFSMKASLNNQGVNIFVRSGKGIVHYECFDSSHVLSLKQLTKLAVIQLYSRRFIKDLRLPYEIKRAILASC